MEAEELVENIEVEKKTELSRLNSSKNLLAQTDGEIDVENILKETINSENSAIKTFQAWKKSEKNSEIKENLNDFESIEKGHLKKVEKEINNRYSPIDNSSLHEYMRSLEATQERLGALIGRSLVSDNTLKQTTVFFVGRGEEKRADIFREMRKDNKEILDKTKKMLNKTCKDWGIPERTAKKTIDIVYSNYAETLEGLGINPKPVC